MPQSGMNADPRFVVAGGGAGNKDPDLDFKIEAGEIKEMDSGKSGDGKLHVGSEGQAVPHGTFTVAGLQFVVDTSPGGIVPIPPWVVGFTDPNDNNRQADDNVVQVTPKVGLRGGDGIAGPQYIPVKQDGRKGSSLIANCLTTSASSNSQVEVLPKIYPIRTARILDSDAIKIDPDCDLDEAPPTVTSPYKKTGWNGLPFRPRNGTSSRDWNFNGNEPLPGKAPAAPQGDPFVIREFAKCNDTALLDYIGRRGVSRRFFYEVDQVLRSHSGIARHARHFVEHMNSLPPLDAYLYFLKGYTRPARYMEGIIQTDNFSLPVGFRPTSLRSIHDTELDDFFDGFEYRYDILDRIDMEVEWACTQILQGRRIYADMIRLVCYAIKGNPVDAYKYFEYNYQQEYMPHRYLREHVILEEIPKPPGYREPEPTKLKRFRGFGYVRNRMARAKDQGVDVIDVLVSEYRSALVKKGLRRPEIDRLCFRAEEKINNEREYPRGVDVVDMIMEDVATRVAPPPRPAYIHPVPIKRQAGRLTENHPAVGPLRDAYHSLVRVYAQEDAIMINTRMYTTGQIAKMKSSRGRAERRYVRELTGYLQKTGQMQTREASEIKKMFTKQKMKGQAQIHRKYLLSMYPSQLKLRM